jgi:transcriptional regulator with XRE-family HTH domain
MGGLERGERNLTLKAVERLADKLNIPETELFLGR